MNSQQQNYRNNAQSPIPVIYQPPSHAVQYVHQPPSNPVQYVQQPQQQYQQVQQVQQVQPNNQCQCNCHQQQSPNPVSQNQNRDIGDIVTSVIGEEKMKETMKDEEIKMLKLQLDILDGKLSEIVAKKVKKFCF